MKRVSFLLIILYVAAFVFDSVLVKSGTASTRYLTKGLLMPLLLTFFLVEVNDGRRDRSFSSVRFICVALIFSFVGDMFLVNDEGKYNFTLGLASFLVVQVCYILFFYRTKPFTKKNVGFLLVATLLITGYLVMMNYIFWPKAYHENFIGPVLAYSIALGLMLLCAVNIINSHRFNKAAIFFLIPGAVSFVASDSMIAANRFYFPPTRSLPDYYTLGTYCLAQFLIVMGAIWVIRRKK